jgi:Zn-dependent protease/predicted transcriptional regulator
MFESSVKIGSVAGIRIGVHYTWLIIFLLMSFTLYSFFVAKHPDWSGVVAIGTAVVTTLLFFASIILHELGHSIVAIRRGISVRSITLFVFGGVAQSERDADDALTEFLVAIAGPLVSLVLAGAFHVLQIVLSPISLVAAESCGYLAYINLAVAIFNMVPGFPLDGGRVFRSLVWGYTGDSVKGMNWAVAAGKLVAYGLMALGVFAFTSGLFVNGIWFFGIGWFLLVSAQASGRAFTVDRATHGLTVGDLMQRDLPMVSASSSIDDWVHHHVLVEGARAALVAEGDSVRGLVTLSDCRKVDKGRWATTTVGEVMTPVAHLKTVAPGTPISSVLELMAQHSLNQIPVVDGGKIVGWIDREGLMSVLRLRVEAGD